MTRRNFSLQEENDFKVQLRFVKGCALVVTEGYHVLYISAEQIKHMPFYYVEDVYHKNQLRT